MISPRMALSLLVHVAWLASVVPAAHGQQSISEQEATEIGTEAYIYGYPLVTMEMTRRVMTNVAAPEKNHAPMGRFFNARTYPDAMFRDVTAPNADTLYSTAWLDLSEEPYVLSLPDEGDRYYLMPMLSAWTEVFAVPGTRTTGTKARTFAITGPGWSGKLPEGVEEIKAPTRMVWILGRTYCTGTREDYAAVHALQDRYDLVPLSAYGKPYKPPGGRVDPSIDMKTAVREQVHHMDAASYFQLMAELLKANPPAADDSPVLARLARIGIVPGQDFALGDQEPAVAKGLQRAPEAGIKAIMGHASAVGKPVNGWVYMLGTGRYGTDYLRRAFVAAIGLGANRPEDAIYPYTQVDGDSKPLTGANRYVIRFPAGQTPPVNGFWSITMYDREYFFVPNPLDRYSISPRNGPKANADGSVDLYIQHASPGPDRESNWLPAPEGDFILMLRMYWPKAEVIDGSWQPPSVKRVP